jgi:hypothetical protein
MKKSLALLVALLFAMTSPVLAAGTTLSDSEMDDINAGQWVVLGEEGSEYVEEVHFNNNDISLFETAQTDIKAVSNANAVDSAIAVQTNITNASGEIGTNNAVSGSNDATIENMNPSDAGGDAQSSLTTLSETTTNMNSHGSSASYKYGSESSFGSKKIETNYIDETLDIAFAAAAVGEGMEKGSKSEMAAAAALTVDYDYDRDYVYGEEATMAYSKSGEGSMSADCESSSSTTTTTSESTSNSKWNRSNKSENNHIWLEDTAQTNIQAVSNLNAVGSGAAAQANIANSVAIAGSISHSNIASVANGL